jgi:hypothetical protein
MKKFFAALMLAAALFAAGNQVYAQGQAGTAAVATQATSTTTAVPIEGNSGTITTFTQTLAALSSVAFTVTDSAVNANSSVQVSVNNYTGTLFTNGVPIVQVQGITAGSFTIRVLNTHATTALAGVLKIGFRVD